MIVTVIVTMVIIVMMIIIIIVVMFVHMYVHKLFIYVQNWANANSHSSRIVKQLRTFNVELSRISR